MSSKRITCKGRVMAFLLAFATAMSSFPMTNVFADDDVDSTSVSSSSVGTDSVTVMLESGSGGTLKATLPDGTVYTSSENEENSFEMESGTKITLAAIPDQGYKVGVYQIDTADGEHYSEEGKDDGSPVTNRVTISEDAYVVANYEEISTESSSSSSSGSETGETPVVDGGTTSGSSDNASGEMVPFVSGLEYAEENGKLVTDKEDNDFWKAVAGEGTEIYEAKMDIKDPSMIEQQNFQSDPTNPVAEVSDVSARSLSVEGINKNLKIDQHVSVVVRYIAPGDPGMSTGYYTKYGYHINMAYIDADISKTQPSCPAFTFSYSGGTVTARGWRWAYCVQHANPTPNGNTLTWNSANDDNNIHITYLLANAPKCVGDRAPLDKYRVKGVPYEWQADYIAASLALHVLRGEYSLATLKANMVDGANSGYSKIMYDVVKLMVTDASNFGGNANYRMVSVGGRTQAVFVSSKKLTSDQKDNTVTNCGFYISNSNDGNKISTGKEWVDTTYKGVKGKVCTLQWAPHYDVSGQDYKYYIAQLSFDKSKLPAGSKIIRPAGSVEAAEIDNNANIQVFIPDSEFKRIAKDTTYRIEVEAAVPGGLYATKFTCSEHSPTSGNKYQDMAWMSLGGGYQIAKFPFYVTVQQQVQPGNIKLIKKSSNTDLTNGNTNYSLEGAEYGVYEKKDCSGKASYTMTIKKGTDGTYTATQKEIPAGTWYVKETKAPNGYTLNSKVYEVEVPQNNTIEVDVEDNPITLTINLEKVSALPDCTNNNENYSLQNAVYMVYMDDTCKSPAMKDGKNVTLTTDENGKASVSGLPKGTYYVKETTASKGFSKDTKVYTVDGTNDKDASAGVISKTVNSSEIPDFDPLTILLKKTDSKGDVAQSLENAKFVVTYYTKMMTTDPALQGIAYTRKWVFKTKKVGNVYISMYDESYKVSGPALYVNDLGNPELPFGTVTIQEQESADGYAVDSTMHVICLDGSGKVGISNDTALTIPNNSVDFNIVKKQYGTESVISGAVFKHTDPNGKVETVTTDKNGKASFRGLIDGKHIIEETYVDPAYFVNDHKIEFTVTGGQISKEGLDKLQFEASGTNGSIKVTANKEDGYDAVIEDKPAYYKLQMHKVNDVDTKLAGAEFTLYSDAACTKVLKKGTTDSNGILTMEQLTIGQIYYLAETKAPNGYRLPLKNGKPVVYTIRGDSSSKDNFAIVVNDKTYSGSSGEWYVSGSGSDRYAHFRVVNQRQTKLPNTGSHAMLIIVIAGLALVVGALVFERKNKKKK